MRTLPEIKFRWKEKLLSKQESNSAIGITIRIRTGFWILFPMKSLSLRSKLIEVSSDIYRCPSKQDGKKKTLTKKAVESYRSFKLIQWNIYENFGSNSNIQRNSVTTQFVHILLKKEKLISIVNCTIVVGGELMCAHLFTLLHHISYHKKQ